MHATCDCGARVQAVPASPSDWAWEDRDGHTAVALPPVPWDELREHDVATYSALLARLNLGMLPAFHVHRPAQPEPFAGVVPFCCGEPMHLQPRGWRCRKRCADAG